MSEPQLTVAEERAIVFSLLMEVYEPGCRCAVCEGLGRMLAADTDNLLKRPKHLL